MSETVLVPGPREVRGTLDTPDARACVVACPPHPQMGGDRTDSRLRAVADALGEAGMACLRIDYGAWDEGRGETDDAERALAWAREEYESVGLFGYSFGGAVALLAAAGTDVDLRAVSVLAPAGTPADGDLDAAAAVDDVACPLQVVYGERDTTASWERVVERARERDCEVVALPADHFFVGTTDRAASAVAGFLAGRSD
ncbi:MAG: dienelactone hydrolase family protein [Haloarculaceae archaeon]